MKVIDALWTKSVNFFHIKCECGAVFYQRVDRFKIVCPVCKRKEYKNSIKISLKRKRSHK